MPYFCAVPPDTPIRANGIDAIPSAGPYYVALHNAQSRARAAAQSQLPRLAATPGRGNPDAMWDTMKSAETNPHPGVRPPLRFGGTNAMNKEASA